MGTLLAIYVKENFYIAFIFQVLALVSLLIIITSVITFCLESMPHLNVYKRTFEILDFVYCAVFTMDFLARVFSCPNLRKFFRSTLTWCDIVSVLPFYINIIWQVDYLNVFLVVRLFRIFRLFRFFRFMSGMQVIGHTLKASARELFLLVLILFIPMVIFSSLLFYTEKVKISLNAKQFLCSILKSLIYCSDFRKNPKSFSKQNL